MKIGFLGAGNMGGAILDGLLAKKFVSPQEIFASGRDLQKLRVFCTVRNITACKTNEELVQKTDVLIVGIKPNMFASVLPPLAQDIQKKSIIIVSVAAGISLEKIASLIGKEVPIVRGMPNVNASVGQSMTALCPNEHITVEQMEYVTSIFDSVGKTQPLDENIIATFSAIAGASPAYVFKFIDALAQAGVQGGMTKKDALFASTQAVLGSAQLLQASKAHPSVASDTVCSPGGTTIAGLVALEKGAFTGTVMQAIAAVIQRDKELQ